ncbi:HGxxPAAW family protein [Streptomyces ficellus]|uniref:HGxxPAAW family protein n=1 Tax=Streptomyces ficellus TaxID=1977088 RepID=A0ABT7ZC47_9ACTN|nr:HGxxPAAW family protein [Streptomyces ficellus]MDN3297073.1 HGxxPAAW family protein [Streptomyces ficellus]
MAGSDHGHTPAAWTGVTISFIGFCVAGAFMVAANPLGFWVGMAVVLLGGVVGYAMKLAGLGAKESPDLVRAREEAARADHAGEAAQEDARADTHADARA